jgi:hypothetical protein
MKTIKNYHFLLSCILALLVLNIVITLRNKPLEVAKPVQTDPVFTNVVRPAMTLEEAMRDYQIQFESNGDVTIWDGRRYVGSLEYSPTCKFHKLMDRDND